MRERLRLAALVFAMSQAAGCSSAYWQRVGQNLAAVGPAAVPAPAIVSGKLMVFGGTGHDVYLGCLNCPEYASDSIFNTYGQFGSPYSTTSILNQYGRFGSAYSSESACNPYATDPPVIVDGAGHFHGYLTANEYKPGAVSDPTIRAWLLGVCGR